MSPRFTKELRPLLLPWVLASVAAVGHFAARPSFAYFHGAFGDFIAGLAGVAFVLGVLVLAAMPIGAELHERTLAMLFSQPMGRLQLWKEKLFAASVMISLLLVIHGLAALVTGRLDSFSALLYFAFAVTAICSVGYHTLATRSVLVGIACAVGMPYAITLSTYLIVRYLLGVELELSDRAALTLILIACGAYSALSLWLSRRQFVNLELKAGIASRAAEVPTALIPKALSNLFRPQPTGVVLNLIRKEVCLHKPIFLVSAIFTVAWLLTLVLMLLRPAWHDNCVATLYGLTGAQVVLMVILGGCTALGDDKALGTSIWHLTLPVSARRQWFIKLLTAFGTTLAVAVVLPIFLAILTLFKAQVGLLAARSDTQTTLTLLCLGAFILSFWSASMTTNTVRAALMCVFTLFGIAAMVALGVSLSETLFSQSPIQRDLVAWLFAQFQISPDQLAQHPGVSAYPILLLSLVFVFAALLQSLALFRRGQTPGFVRIKYATVLAAIAFFGTFWLADLSKALPTARARFESELGEAWALLPYKNQLPINKTLSVSAQELEKTGELSPTTVRWLRGSNITITQTDTQTDTDNVYLRRYNNAPFLISITFPNGQVHAFVYAYSLPRN